MKSGTRSIVRTGAAAVLSAWVCSAPVCAGQIMPPGAGTFVFVPSAPGSGVVPNTLPFTETFDPYPVNFTFESPTNGWAKTSGDASATAPVTALPVTPSAPSLFSGGCLSLATEGGTFYNVTTGSLRDVWADLSVLLVPCEERPVPSSGTRLGVLLDMDSRLVAYCGLTNSFAVSDIQFAPSPGQTFRLTLQITFADELAVPHFRVFVDHVAVVWSAGCRLPGVPSGRGGEWLPCAGTGRAFSGLAFQGNGYVDSLTLSGAYLGPDVQPQAGIAQAVAVSWLSDYGRSYQVEACENLEGGEWQPFGAPVLGNGETNTVFDTVGPSSRKFYRVTPL